MSLLNIRYQMLRKFLHRIFLKLHLCLYILHLSQLPDLYPAKDPCNISWHTQHMLYWFVSHAMR